MKFGASISSNSTYKTSIGSGTRMAPPLRGGTLGSGLLKLTFFFCELDFDSSLFVAILRLFIIWLYAPKCFPAMISVVLLLLPSTIIEYLSCVVYEFIQGNSSSHTKQCSIEVAGCLARLMQPCCCGILDHSFWQLVFDPHKFADVTVSRITSLRPPPPPRSRQCPDLDQPSLLLLTK